jgi:hypothetical protein
MILIVFQVGIFNINMHIQLLTIFIFRIFVHILQTSFYNSDLRDLDVFIGLIIKNLHCFSLLLYNKV